MRMSVINNTTNGKNDRIAFAATEKAKVWTSVFSRYLIVDETTPGYWTGTCPKVGPDETELRLETTGGMM